MAIAMDILELQQLLLFFYIRVESTAILPEPSILWLKETSANFRLVYRVVGLNLTDIIEEAIDNSLSALIFLLNFFIYHQPLTIK